MRTSSASSRDIWDKASCIRVIHRRYTGYAAASAPVPREPVNKVLHAAKPFNPLFALTHYSALDYQKNCRPIRETLSEHQQGAGFAPCCGSQISSHSLRLWNWLYRCG